MTGPALGRCWPALTCSNHLPQHLRGTSGLKGLGTGPRRIDAALWAVFFDYDGDRPVSSLRWLRFISPAYRDALKAEAEGRYIEAARAYAVVGESLKVAEMHILEAECQGAPASALRELHVASHFVDEAADSQEGRALLLRLGQIYLRILKKSVLTPAEHDVCAYAAQLLLRAGDARAAAEAYELAGDLSQAAQAYEQAGEIEKVEQLHDALAQNRRERSDEQSLWQRFELSLELGNRADALSCIDQLCRTARDPSLAHQRRAALRERLLAPFHVRLRLRQSGRESESIFIGRLPLVLGRDGGAGGTALQTAASLPFADPGLSRSHAQIESTREATATTPASELGASGRGLGFVLRDLGSKNGTSLAGLTLASATAVPLRGQGEIGLGQKVRLHYEVKVDAACLLLRVTRGLSRGLQVVVSERPFALQLASLDGDASDPTAAASKQGSPPEPVASQDAKPDDSRAALVPTALVPTAPVPLLMFATDDGQPWLQASESWLLNGKRVAPHIQVLRGDVLRTPDGLQIEVL